MNATTRPLLICGLLACGVASGAIHPTADCWEMALDGTITVDWGYDDDDADDRTQSLPTNKFFPAPLWRMQPFQFSPGAHRRVLSVAFNPADFPSLTWNLDGTSATFDINTTAPRCSHLPAPRIDAVLPPTVSPGGSRVVVLGGNFKPATDLLAIGATTLSCLDESLCYSNMRAQLSYNNSWIDTSVTTAVTMEGGRSDPGPVISYPQASATQPELIAIAPDRGSNRGGTQVTLTGTGFPTDGSAQVWFGATQSASVTCSSDTRCTATAPAGNGSAPVFLTSAGGATDPSSAAVRFSYVAANVEAIAADPAAPNLIYAAIGGLGVYRSQDGGTSWSEANSGLASREVHALLLRGGVLYVGTEAGVFRSTDGAASWQSASSGLGNLFVKSLAPGATSSTLYAGTQNGVFVSTDGGTSWSAKNAGLP